MVSGGLFLMLTTVKTDSVTAVVTTEMRKGFHSLPRMQRYQRKREEMNGK